MALEVMNEFRKVTIPSDQGDNINLLSQLNGLHADTYVPVAFSIFSEPAVAQSKSPTTAGIVSTVLPGAGQLYNGQATKGYYFMSIYASALALAIITNPSTWQDAPEDPTGGFFDDLNPGGTAASTKLIFYASAGVAAVTLLGSVLDAVSGAKVSAVRRPRYSTNLVPILAANNKGALLTARIRF